MLLLNPDSRRILSCVPMQLVFHMTIIVQEEYVLQQKIRAAEAQANEAAEVGARACSFCQICELCSKH